MIWPRIFFSHFRMQKSLNTVEYFGVCLSEYFIETQQNGSKVTPDRLQVTEKQMNVTSVVQCALIGTPGGFGSKLLLFFNLFSRVICFFEFANMLLKQGGEKPWRNVSRIGRGWEQKMRLDENLVEGEVKGRATVTRISRLKGTTTGKSPSSCRGCTARGMHTIVFHFQSMFPLRAADVC